MKHTVSPRTKDELDALPLKGYGIKDTLDSAPTNGGNKDSRDNRRIYYPPYGSKRKGPA